MLYEARRRLADGLVVLDARQGTPGKVWIRPESEQEVIGIVTRDLARGHRSRISPAALGLAFDSLVIALRRELPNLAAFGFVHERPRETELLKKRLIEGMEKQLASSG
jgi:hypothetical protein